jgi:hypothetical protein
MPARTATVALPAQLPVVQVSPGKSVAGGVQPRSVAGRSGHPLATRREPFKHRFQRGTSSEGRHRDRPAHQNVAGVRDIPAGHVRQPPGEQMDSSFAEVDLLAIDACVNGVGSDQDVYV